MCALLQPWLRPKHRNSNIGVERESLFQRLADGAPAAGVGGGAYKGPVSNAAQLSQFSGIFGASSGGHDETEGSTPVRAHLASIQKFMIYEF